MLPFPSRNQMTITTNGCLVFDVHVNNMRVHYCIWMTIGEVRIGAKIDQRLMPENMPRKIAQCYDGHPCRQVTVGNAIMFDWIFRDAFAGFDNMIAALRDPLIGAVIAKRIGEILVHIYVTTLSTLYLQYPNATIAIDKGAPTTKRVKKYAFFTGDMEYFKTFVIDRGVAITNGPNLMESGIMLAHIETDENGSGITRGSFASRDGAEIRITEVGFDRR